MGVAEDREPDASTLSPGCPSCGLQPCWGEMAGSASRVQSLTCRVLLRGSAGRSSLALGPPRRLVAFLSPDQSHPGLWLGFPHRNRIRWLCGSGRSGILSPQEKLASDDGRLNWSGDPLLRGDQHRILASSPAILQNVGRLRAGADSRSARPDSSGLGFPEELDRRQRTIQRPLPPWPAEVGACPGRSHRTFWDSRAALR